MMHINNVNTDSKRIIQVDIPHWSNERLITIEQVAPSLPIEVTFQVTRQCFPCSSCHRRLQEIGNKIAGTNAIIRTVDRPFGEDRLPRAMHYVVWEITELPESMHALILWIEERLQLGLTGHWYNYVP